LDPASDAINIDELPKRMLELEARAFEAFAAEFGPRFRAYFLRRGLPVSDAEDLAASCVTDVALKVPRFSSQGRGSFERWVFTLVHRAFVDWLREREPVKLVSEGELARGVFGTEIEPNEAVCAAVDEALEQINDSDRAIVALRDMEQHLSYDEIAERLHMSTGNVRVRHHRAMKRLQTILSRHPTIRPLLNRLRDVEPRDSEYE